MNRIAVLIILFSSILLNAQSLNDLSWLAGEWVNFTPEDSSYEVWQKNNDGTLNGYGLTIINGDTAFYEELNIIEKNDTIYYQARIEDQNNGEPVLFKYFYRAPGHIFFNREHDFPQKIIYTPSNDTLYIKLEGIEEYYEKSVDLIFVRSKP